MNKYLNKIALYSLFAAGIILFSCSKNTGIDLTDYTISGKITDANNNPVQDAKVSAIIVKNDTVSTTTNAKGEWSLTNLIGEVTITPQKSGLTFSPGYVTVSSSDDWKTFKFIAKEIPVTDFTIDSSVRYQKIYGFGASTAWYEGWIVAHPNKSEIYDALFKDLGITILRLQNWYDKDSSSVEYDADIVKKAGESLGYPVTVLMTSWEMPKNIQSADRDTSKNGVNITLKKVNGAYVYDQFADYWLSSLDAYKKAGVVPTYISVQNEPDYWPYGRFMPTETNQYAGYGKALNAVYNKLQANMSSPPEIVGPETAGIGYNTVENYAAAMNLNQVSAIAFHLYGPSPADPSTINSFQTIAGQYKDKPIFMTEFSNDKESALNTAVFIHNALVDGNVNMYLFWELFWADGGDGLVALQNPWDTAKWTTSKGYYKTEKYYSVQQYSKFIRPGFYRISMNENGGDVKSSAYVSPDNTGNSCCFD